MPPPEALRTIPEENEDVGSGDEEQNPVVPNQDSPPTERGLIGTNLVSNLFKQTCPNLSLIGVNEEASCSSIPCVQPLAEGLDLSLCLKKKTSSQPTALGNEPQQSITQQPLSTMFVGAPHSIPSGMSYTGRKSHNRSASVNWTLHGSVSKGCPTDAGLNPFGSVDPKEDHRQIVTLIDELAESPNKASKLSKIVGNAPTKYNSLIDNLKDVNEQLKRVEMDLTDSYIVVREIQRAKARQLYTGKDRMETVLEEDGSNAAVRPNLPSISARGQAFGRDIEHHFHLQMEKERLQQKVRDIFEKLLEESAEETKL